MSIFEDEKQRGPLSAWPPEARGPGPGPIRPIGKTGIGPKGAGLLEAQGPGPGPIRPIGKTGIGLNVKKKYVYHLYQVYI